MRTVVVLVTCAVLGLAGACTTEDPRAGERWPMPDLVGANLRDAQDRIHDLTDGAVAVTSTHPFEQFGDARDRDWRICTQSIAPGAALTARSTVEFGVVKPDQPCD
ncbi:PASTA domain-containing protein [Actinophytocola sp. KF-1]